MLRILTGKSVIRTFWNFCGLQDVVFGAEPSNRHLARQQAPTRMELSKTPAEEFDVLRPHRIHSFSVSVA
jgi:hypothetical protein